MKIIEAINKVDSLKPNQYTQNDKVGWLSQLDSAINKEIINNSVNISGSSFEGYNDCTNLETELLVPAPYDDIYLHWLSSRIDLWNGELARYNNSLMAYNYAYSVYARYYIRNNMPKHPANNRFRI